MCVIVGSAGLTPCPFGSGVEVGQVQRTQGMATIPVCGKGDSGLPVEL